MSEFALELRGVTKYYGRRKALDGLDLAVPTGSVCGLVGSNGAGKTTTMAVATGMLRARDGTINVLGQGPFDPAVHTGRVALLPQDTELPRVARVRELLIFYAELQGMDRCRARACASEILEWVHLADRADSTIRSLSHGMRRRLMLAQAFLGEPELVLLDEPQSGLDPREVANVRSLLQERRGRQTILISSHNLHELERICDHVAFIENGRALRMDTMAAVTGREHVLQFRLGRGAVPVEELCRRLPAAVFEWPEAKLQAPDAEGTLLCRYAEADGSAAAINGAVLKALLDAGVEVLEVRRGSELEAAFLGQGATPRATPG